MLFINNSFNSLKYFRRNKRNERLSSAVSHSSIVNENVYFQITNLSKSSSDSDFYQYQISPKNPDFNIPEGITDGLSDFE